VKTSHPAGLVGDRRPQLGRLQHLVRRMSLARIAKIAKAGKGFSSSESENKFFPFFLGLVWFREALIGRRLDQSRGEGTLAYI
jgi:hypothetical protein